MICPCEVTMVCNHNGNQSYNLQASWEFMKTFYINCFLILLLNIQKSPYYISQLKRLLILKKNLKMHQFSYDILIYFIILFL